MTIESYQQGKHLKLELNILNCSLNIVSKKCGSWISQVQEWTLFNSDLFFRNCFILTEDVYLISPNWFFPYVLDQARLNAFSLQQQKTPWIPGPKWLQVPKRRFQVSNVATLKSRPRALASLVPVSLKHCLFLLLEIIHTLPWSYKGRLNPLVASNNHTFFSVLKCNLY